MRMGHLPALLSLLLILSPFLCGFLLILYIATGMSVYLGSFLLGSVFSSSFSCRDRLKR